MNIRRQLLLLIALLFLSGCGGAANSWNEYTSEEGRFRVLMYGQPKEETKEIDKTATHSFETNPKKNVAYIVVYFDVPDDPKERGKPEYADKVLNEYCLRSEKNTEGKIQSAKRVQLEKYPGREVLIEGPNDITYRMRYILVNDRCYQIVAAGPKDTVASEEADKFMNSFRPIE